MAGSDSLKIKLNKKGDAVYNTETMLPFSEIQGNTVILKDGGLRGVIKVEGVNLDLKNGDEIAIVIEQYKRFVNGLGFPVQIIVRNTYLDLSEYLKYVTGNVTKIDDNPVLKQQGEKYLQFLDSINLQQGLVFSKEFYVVVPFYPAGEDDKNVRKARWAKLLDTLNAKDSAEKIVQRYRWFVKNRRKLDTRVSLIMDGLAGIGLTVSRLQLKELTELFFKYYNPQADSSQA